MSDQYDDTHASQNSHPTPNGSFAATALPRRLDDEPTVRTAVTPPGGIPVPQLPLSPAFSAPTGWGAPVAGPAPVPGVALPGPPPAGAVAPGAQPVWAMGESSVAEPAKSVTAAVSKAASGGGRPRAVTRSHSRRGWRRWLYRTVRVNVGMSKDELYEQELHRRIRRDPTETGVIAVLGLKGGVGKTALTATLGSILGQVRGDLVLAVDADPDCGNLVDRCGRESASSVADLLAAEGEIERYNHVRAFTHMNRANLQVLASLDYSRADRAFNDRDWARALKVVSRYFNLVLADGGHGLFHDAARGVLMSATSVVLVTSPTFEGLKQTAVAMDWLGRNGYQHLLPHIIVVVNHAAPGRPNSSPDRLVELIERHLGTGRVVVLPWDKHIATTAEIDLDLVSAAYLRKVTELAAVLSDGFGGRAGSGAPVDGDHQVATPTAAAAAVEQ